MYSTLAPWALDYQVANMCCKSIKMLKNLNQSVPQGWGLFVPAETVWSLCHPRRPFKASVGNPCSTRLAQDYYLDVLGGWDYAVEDPEGILGGPLPPGQAAAPEGSVGFGGRKGSRCRR